MNKIIRDAFRESIAVKERAADALAEPIENAAHVLIDALKRGDKILICGNGGSASQAVHFSAELLVRFERERASIPAIALCADIATLTAGANDYGYEAIFARQTEGLGNVGDVLVGLTTSGKSPNVLSAFSAAKRKGLQTICFNGKDGGKVTAELVDVNIIVPSQSTARIQEVHGLIIHILCDLIERAKVAEDVS